MLGVAEGVPDRPRPNAVAGFLLRAIAELRAREVEPGAPLEAGILRAAHRMLCEEADLRRFAGGAARVALAEVRADRVTTLYTAAAGVYLVDRHRGEVKSLATIECAVAADSTVAGALVADPAASDFSVYRAQSALSHDHTIVLCSDGVTSLVSAKEIGDIVQNAAHRDDAAEAILGLVNARGAADNASVLICDVSWPDSR